MGRPTFTDNTDPLAILELADEFSEDDFGNTTHTFKTPVATLVLERCWYDGDTAISVIVPTQDVPIIKLELIGCDSIRVVNDKRGKFFEFAGQARIEEFSRGSNRKTLGFRVYLTPFVSVEPYFFIESM